ncbi:winged helix-turn-helix transcriptional regulator [Geodermatophilus maliterrae]|uniref:Winged helix-turn-helix transcriptional regulator n=1 Tax=Geodermatophilus maliterrae TaxID=3162531 RepID=A0ABV3XAB9_9ACTN
MPTHVTRSYGQFCGLARALEIIGERWAMLVVRDLILGPKRFPELQATLPRIPASLLAARLNELEQSGVVRRRVLGDLDAAVVYELTEYGNELDHIVLSLGLWGARSLNYPGPGDVFTLDAAVLSMYTTFRPEAAAGVQIVYQLNHVEDMVVHAVVDDGALKVDTGPHDAPDLVITPHGPGLLDLLNGRSSAAEAIAAGSVEVEGRAEDLELFTELFHIPAAPAAPRGLAVH